MRTARYHRQRRTRFASAHWHCQRQSGVSQRNGPTLESKYGRVSVLDKDGRVLARWGTPNAEAPGSFAAPHGLAVDSRGAVYVAEVTWTFAVSRGHAREDCHTFQKFNLKS